MGPTSADPTRCRACKCCTQVDCNFRRRADGCPCNGNTVVYTLTVEPFLFADGPATVETVNGSAALSERINRSVGYIARTPSGMVNRGGTGYFWTSEAAAIPLTDERGNPVEKCPRCSGTGTFCGGVCFKCQGARYVSIQTKGRRS